MIYTIRRNTLKSLFSFLFIISIPFISIGGGIDLNKLIEELENIEVKDDCNDKKRLNQLIHLFKDEIKEEEKNDIYNTFNALEYSCPQSNVYQVILEKIITEYNISCKTLGEEKNALNITYGKQIDDLINEYKYIEKKTPDNYGDNHKKNVEIFKELQRIFNECEVDTSRIDSLKNDIATAGFGNLTNDFKDVLEDLIAQLKEGELGVNIRSHEEDETESIVVESTEAPIEKFEIEYEHWIIIISGSVFLVLVIFLALKILNSKKTSKDFKNGKKKRSESFSEQVIEGLRKENRELNSTNNNLIDKISKLEERIRKLEGEKEEWKEKSLREEILSSEPIIKSSSPPRTRTLYFAIPNQRGEFTSVGEEVAKPYASSYKFYISHDGRSAEFEFYNQKSTFSSALDDPNRILPVCEPLNAYNPKASEIKTIRKGLVLKEGNKWVLKRKAEIKYV